MTSLLLCGCFKQKKLLKEEERRRRKEGTEKKEFCDNQMELLDAQKAATHKFQALIMSIIEFIDKYI
nr:hypothetical protein [Tanacetum cinerariifolium]